MNPVTRVAILALVTALATAGCLSETVEPQEDEFDPESTMRADEDAVTHAFSGTLTGTPVAPGEETFTFDVPRGATEVAATLTWGNAPVSNLQVTLLDPQGKERGRGFPESEGQRSVATVDPPRAGTWTAAVSTNRALDEDFDLEVRVSLLVPLDNRLADQVEMRASTFKEINLIMEDGATFNWSFESSNGPVRWDIHSHPEGEGTKYHEEGMSESHEGSFTADGRDVYSILFESTTPTTVTYEVQGAFRVHSHSR